MTLGDRIDEFVATSAPAEADLYASRREWKHVVASDVAQRLRAVVSAQLRLWQRQGASPFAAPADEADWRKIARIGFWAWRNR